VLVALTANRALHASSKLAAADWVTHEVHIPGLPTLSDDVCYRAMDRLIEIEPRLTRCVYDRVADLLNLHAGLLFFDTTSTYFELDEADELLWRDERGTVVDEGAPQAVKQAGFRAYGKSKDHRDDLPQVVIGMAVTREGIPVRCWVWPGGTADSAPETVHRGHCGGLQATSRGRTRLAGHETDHRPAPAYAEENARARVAALGDRAVRRRRSSPRRWPTTGWWRSR
jgi:hypothetical protein